jgi:hypothetical protein
MVAKAGFVSLVIITLMAGIGIGVGLNQAMDDDTADSVAPATEATATDSAANVVPTPGPGADAPRVGVEWCIDALRGDSAVSAGAVAIIEEQLPQLRTIAPRSRSIPESVSDGCPKVPSAFAPGETEAFDGEDPYFEIRGRLVTSPGRYSAMIWVASDDYIARFFGPTGDRLGAEERICHSDVCNSVTSGVYLAESELLDKRFVSYWLHTLVGAECSIPATDIPAGLAAPERCE